MLSILLLAGALSAGCGGGAKKALAGKAEELMNTQAAEKLDSAARIGGKVAVVEAYPSMPASLEGFNADGTIDHLSAFFFSPRRKAQSVEEIETLVKVNCRQGDAIAGSSPTMYASLCDVSLIDFKTKTLFARKRFENNSTFNGVSPSNPSLARTPSEEIKAYLREFSTYD
ncbi:MAG TPA: hypothetical protein VJT74_09470 [Pyrinomonadaceae bacterium]|nr:hypothetical protein [Pyrinomonadaceae bacterium]